MYSSEDLELFRQVSTMEACFSEKTEYKNTNLTLSEYILNRRLKGVRLVFRKIFAYVFYIRLNTNISNPILFIELQIKRMRLVFRKKIFMNLERHTPGRVSLSIKLKRVVWNVTAALLFRPFITPVFRKWRLLLRLFGAQVE